MFTHNLDPVLIDFGFLAIRWYSLSYIFGILLGWWYGKKIIKNISSHQEQEFNLKKFDDLITYLILSIIIGGRLGYIFFYNLEYYVSNPMNIFKIWEGGMSFHGALLGIVLGTYLFSKKNNLKTFFVLDIISCVSPIGIFLGRIANFINGELVGKVTTVPWSVIFPSLDLLPRHPAQLYEAFLEGVILFIILNYVIHKKRYQAGLCSSLFLIFYGALRVVAEFFREPDAQVGYLFNIMSMGTALSILMIFFGFLIFNSIKKMKSDIKFFKNFNSLPIDKFFHNVLYDPKNGYYNTQQPFGDKGDYITAPKISNLFSEMIAIWIISVWENFGKPKRLNIVELGPGDGTLMKDLLNVFRKFPSFNLAKQIYMFETSKFLKKFQKKNINDKSVKWINNLVH